MQTIENILKRAEQEQTAGRAWRAREILRGNLSSRSYSDQAQDLYRAYATLLLVHGEAVEAGKYFLLSGTITEESESAISLFIQGHSRHPMSIYRSFPGKARLEKLLPKSSRWN